MYKALHILTIAVLVGGYLTVQPDPLIKGQWIVRDKKGVKVEEWRRDGLFKDQINVYDKRGRLKARIRLDPLAPDTWKIEKWGH